MPHITGGQPAAGRKSHLIDMEIGSRTRQPYSSGAAQSKMLAARSYPVG